MTCKSGRTSVASAAGRDRLEGATIRMASPGAKPGWDDPPYANREGSSCSTPRTEVAGLSSSATPGKGPGLTPGSAQVAQNPCGECREGQLLCLIDEDRRPHPPPPLPAGNHPCLLTGRHRVQIRQPTPRQYPEPRHVGRARHHHRLRGRTRQTCWVPTAQRSQMIPVARVPKMALLDGAVTRILPPPPRYRRGIALVG